MAHAWQFLYPASEVCMKALIQVVLEALAALDDNGNVIEWLFRDGEQ